MTSARGVQAAMLDRDGTIVLDTDYLRDPDTVELLPGAAAAIRRLAEAGIPAVVITNQSGIARGIISLEQYRAVRRRVDELLAAEGAVLLDSFACPHHPDLTGPCACRKPGTGLYERAARLYGWDLSRCIFIGDKYRDVAPASAFGARSWLVRSTVTPESDVARARQSTIVGSLAEAVEDLFNPKRVRTAVLASGGGSNLQALLDDVARLGDSRDHDIVLVASDRAECGAIDRARRAGIAVSTIQSSRHPDAPSLDLLLREHDIELVVLAGYLKLIPPEVAARHHPTIINVHPGPLPQFGGAGMYGRHVHRAVLASGTPFSGPTVHWVDEIYDHGRTIAHWPVPVLAGDDEQRLAARVLRAEHLLYPAVVRAFAKGLRWARGSATGYGAPMILPSFDPELDDVALERQVHAAFAG